MARYDIPPSEFDIAGARIGIVAARFNDDVVSRLLEAALDTLARHGLDRENVPVARVPGAFELPLAARWLATRYDPLVHTRGPDAVIALGAVIRGDTPHFDYVCAEAARGIRAVSLELDVPVVFGVLTCDDHAQALERAGGGAPVPPMPPPPVHDGPADLASSASRSRPAAAGDGHRNKGREAALAALEMVSLRRRFGG